MARKLSIDMRMQPDDTTCGPTCLHALYKFYGDQISLRTIISEVDALEFGGTLALLLGIHALKRGYAVRMYTYNITLFDPTWFALSREQLIDKLKLQLKAKRHRHKLKVAGEAAIRFLELGGEINFQELSPQLIRKLLKRGTPLLTGLSATYLYQSARERHDEPDDIAGDPQGHFVILRGYNKEKKLISVADPLFQNPHKTQYYEVQVQRLINAILLGLVTHDANLLVVEQGDE